MSDIQTIELTVGNWTRPIVFWSKLAGTSPRGIWNRYQQGLVDEHCVFGQPSKIRPPKGVRLRIGGTEMTVSRWCQRAAVKSSDVARRLEAGENPANAIFH